MGASGIIFDLDGTLVDTLDDLTNSLNQVLAEYRLPPVTPALVRQMVGDGMTALLQRATGWNAVVRLAAMERAYSPVYARMLLNESRLYPGVSEMLDVLAGSSRPMCVLSNKPHRFTVPLCEALLGRWGFVAFEGHQDGGPRKPNPTVARALAAQMGCVAGEVFFVGDSAVDVQTAKNAGMKSIGVTWGFRGAEELVQAGADYVIEHPREVSELVTRGSSVAQ